MEVRRGVEFVVVEVGKFVEVEEVFKSAKHVVSGGACEDDVQVQMGYCGGKVVED